MAECLTGLEQSWIKADLPKDNGEAEIMLREVTGLSLCQLSFFADQQDEINSYLKGLKLSLPGFSAMEKAGDLSAARVEMTKIWLMGEALPKDIPSHFYPLDISSSKSILSISGARSADVMARLCAVDFRDETRHFHGTAIHHVSLHIHKTGASFDIYMPRSFAESLTDYIIDICRQYHVVKA